MSTTTLARTTDVAARPAAVATTEPVVALKRRSIDAVLIGFGVVATVVFAVAGGLLDLGPQLLRRLRQRPNSRRRTSPSRPPKPDRQTAAPTSCSSPTNRLDTGNEAEAYASYIDGHLDGIADGATYADLGAPESAAKAAVTAAVDAGSRRPRSTSCRRPPTGSAPSATACSRARRCEACSCPPTPGRRSAPSPASPPSAPSSPPG